MKFREVGLEPTTPWFRVKCSTIKLLPIVWWCIEFCGDWNRTNDLEVMSLASYRCSTPQWICIVFVFENGVLGELGFEPRQTDSKSAILPLDDSPSGWVDCTIQMSLPISSLFSLLCLNNIFSWFWVSYHYICSTSQAWCNWCSMADFSSARTGSSPVACWLLLRLSYYVKLFYLTYVDRCVRCYDVLCTTYQSDSWILGMGRHLRRMNETVMFVDWFCVVCDRIFLDVWITWYG